MPPCSHPHSPEQLGFLIQYTNRQCQKLGQDRNRVMFVLHDDTWSTAERRPFEVIQAAARFNDRHRNGKLLPSGLYDHCTLNCETGGEFHGECSTPARHRFDFQRTSEARYAVTYYIQAHTAATFLAQYFGG